MVCHADARCLRVELKGMVAVAKEVVDKAAREVDILANIAILKAQEVVVFITQGEGTSGRGCNNLKSRSSRLTDRLEV